MGEGTEGRGEEGEGRESDTPSSFMPIPHWNDDRYNSQQTVHNLHGFICTFIGILVSNIIIAYALIDTSVDFATVQ